MLSLSSICLTSELRGDQQNVQGQQHSRRRPFAQRVRRLPGRSCGDGLSAGGHFNPVGKPHGAHEQSEHHAGDLPSLNADGADVARISFETSSISVGSGATNVVGRGLIVHRDPDDFKTQPTGNAGPRLACAVIVDK